MKNLKCIIGATILTPMVICGMGAGAFGLIFLLAFLPKLAIDIAGIVVAVFGCLALGVVVWVGIYEYCVKHNSKNI